MTRKRIVLVIPSLKRGGGAERVASVLAGGLQEAGADIHLLTFYSYPDEYPASVTVTCLTEPLAGSKARKLLTRARRIARFCKEKQIDTVLSFTEEANFPALISRRFGNQAEIVVSVRQDPTVYGTSYRQLIRRLYPTAHRVVAVSRQMQQELEISFGLNNVTAIYNPCDIETPRRQGKEPLPPEYAAWTKGRFLFSSVGRLVPQKGQRFLLRALAEVRRNHPEASLVLLGEGELHPELEKLANSLGIAEAVRLPGNQENIYPYLTGSQSFVLPSLWEGFPNTLVEALSCNLPTIATDCPTGPREILDEELPVGADIQYPHFGRYGILIENFPRLPATTTVDRDLLPQERQLAEAMDSLITNLSLRKRYSHGQERVSRLALPAIARQWLELS